MNVLRVLVRKDVRKMYGLMTEEDCGIRKNKETEGHIDTVKCIKSF